MRILFLRHAEPDYVHDSLTEKGEREARYLAERIQKEYPVIKQFYCSPLGRAQKTASYTLSLFHQEAVTCDWLREFDASIDRPDDLSRKHIAWDWVPKDVDDSRELYLPDRFQQNKTLEESDFKGKYLRVVSGFDRILANHGYVREGTYYKVKDSNHDVIAIFSHFGVSSILISRLMNCSPYSIWENAIALPSSLTEFISEERKEGQALFRMNQYSSISHLEMHDEPASFSGRFCECFKDDTRH